MLNRRISFNLINNNKYKRNRFNNNNRIIFCNILCKINSKANIINNKDIICKIYMHQINMLVLISKIIYCK